MGSANGRTENSLKNMAFAIISQLITTIISFLGRTVFVKALGNEYLGISGLFGNILSILALAELGIGAAIVYSLYKPLAEHDEKKISALMGLYRKTYTAIGLFILVAGCALTPFLSFFVSEMPDIDNIHFIYILYVLNNAVAYFFSYKGMLINADQKQRVTTSIKTVSSVVLHIAQIGILLLTKNFILYLFALVFFTLLQNVIISIVADKKYPFLKKYKKERLSKEETAPIITNVKAMILHKIGGIVVDSTDNILISKLVNVLVVGLYSNYYLIINTLSTLLTTLFNALTASVGNLGALESKERVYGNFKIMDFASSWLYCFSFVSLINLFNPFISLWIGEEYLFSMPLVFIISFNFYLRGMRNTLLTYRTALGLFDKDKYKALIEAFVNLVISIILGRHLGALGIFIGTAISTMTVCLTFEPCVVFKYGFDQRVGKYYGKYFVNMLLSLALAAVVYVLSGLVALTGFWRLVFNGVLCLVIPNLVYFALYHNKPEYKEFINIVKRKILRRK